MALVTLEQPQSAAAEAYRGLRTNLAFARPGQGLRSLLVTSPGDEADRREVLANLAVVEAQSGRRVIAVDADLRRPALHDLFGLAAEPGLATVLAGEAELGAALREGPVPGLRVLPAGPIPPNPAELLGAPAMAEALAAMTADADLVLVGAPPVVAVTDAALLAPRLDGVLLVLAAGRSRRDAAQRARERLDKVGAEVTGLVMTGVEPDSTTYRDYGATSA